MPPLPAAPLQAEVPDTRFGTWFQGTEIWRRPLVEGQEYVPLVREAGLEVLAQVTPDAWRSLRDLGARSGSSRSARAADAEHVLVCIAAGRPA
jgi:hypothetical protein